MRSRGFLASVLVLMAAGCGSTDEPLTRREYTDDVNRICTTAIVRSDSLVRGAFAELYGDNPPSDPSPDDLVALYRGILPAARDARKVIEQMLDELRGLRGPGELVAAANGIWDAMERRLAASLERIEDATRDSRAASELDLDDTFPFRVENLRAAELGFTACALT
jgi:hypothetical protein